MPVHGLHDFFMIASPRVGKYLFYQNGIQTNIRAHICKSVVTIAAAVTAFIRQRLKRRIGYIQIFC